MNEERRNLTVGAFVLVGFVLLGWLIIQFGESPMWLRKIIGGATYPVTILFDELWGVQEGTEIRMGVGPVGRVRELAFRDPQRPGLGVKVVADINREILIPAASVAVVHPAALGLGRSTIMIESTGTGAEMLPTDGTGTLRGEMAGALDQVVPPEVIVTLEKTAAAIGTLAEELTPAARDLHELLQPRPLEAVDEAARGGGPRVLANISTLVQRVDLTFKNVNAVIGDPQNQDNLRVAIENLRQTTERARQAAEQFEQFAAELRETGQDARALIADGSELVRNTDARIHDLHRRLVTLSDQMSELLDYANSAARDLAEGQGTAALLLRDTKLYEEMTLTFERLASTVEDLRRLLRQWETQGVRWRL